VRGCIPVFIIIQFSVAPQEYNKSHLYLRDIYQLSDANMLSHTDSHNL
jgi:hypothetical protein